MAEAVPLKSRWAAGEVTFGAWCMMPGALGVEAASTKDWAICRRVLPKSRTTGDCAKQEK